MFWGAVTEDLQAHGERMGVEADHLAEMALELGALIADESSWVGPDADRFRTLALSGVLKELADVAARVRERGGSLIDEATEQEDASSSGTKAVGGAPLATADVLTAAAFLPDLRKWLEEQIEKVENSELPSEPEPREPEEVLIDWLEKRREKAAAERKVLDESDMERIERDYQVPRPSEDEMGPWPPPPAPALRESCSPEEREALTRLAVSDPEAIVRLRQIQSEAAAQAEERFGPVNDPAKDHQEDAFRHAYMNAVSAQRNGQGITEDLYTGHEQIPNSHNGDDRGQQRMAMDLHNNEVGRRIAQQYPDATKEEMAQHIEHAVRRGEMVIIDPASGKLVPSNQV